MLTQSPFISEAAKDVLTPVKRIARYNLTAVDQQAHINKLCQLL